MLEALQRINPPDEVSEHIGDNIKAENLALQVEGNGLREMVDLYRERLTDANGDTGRSLGRERPVLFSAPDQGLDVQLTCRARPPLPRPSRRSGVETETGDPGTPPRYSQLVVQTPNTRFPSPPRPISPMRKRRGGKTLGVWRLMGRSGHLTGPMRTRWNTQIARGTLERMCLHSCASRRWMPSHTTPYPI